MVKCPFCGFDNEDGALFCEQCKSDVSSVEPAAVPAIVEAIPVAAMEPMAEVVAEAVPDVAEYVEAVPTVAEVMAEPIAEVIEVAPVVPAPLPVAPLPVAPLPAPPVVQAPAPIPIPPPVVAVAAVAPVVAAVAAVAAVAPAPEPPAPAPTAPGGASVPAGSQPKLVVIRGQKVNMEFPIYGEYNYIGRADEKPVDVDLEDQEPPERVWCSRQHAVIHFDEAAGVLNIEDLNSANGTYVNRARVYPGQKKQLFPNDVVQIGTVHLKLKA